MPSAPWQAAHCTIRSCVWVLSIAAAGVAARLSARRGKARRGKAMGAPERDESPAFGASALSTARRLMSRDQGFTVPSLWARYRPDFVRGRVPARKAGDAAFFYGRDFFVSNREVADFSDEFGA